MEQTDCKTSSSDSYEALLAFLYRVPIGLAQTNLSGDIEMLNPMSSQLLMPLASGSMLTNVFDVLAEFAPGLRSMVAGHAAPSGVICDSMRIGLHEKDVGHAGPRVLTLSVLKLDAARLMFMMEDASQSIEREQKLITSKLNAAAQIDRLTNMPNRVAVVAYLKNRLAERWANPECGIAILFLNCDRFKQVNDLYGYHSGDRLLIALAERLRSAMREDDLVVPVQAYDHLAARVSSDEFVVVLDDIRRQGDLLSIASRVLERLCEPYVVLDQQIICAVSIGVVFTTAESGFAQDADSLLDDASIAVTEAKRAGGARYLVFDQSMRRRAELRGGLEADLRQALAQNELSVVYQPVVSLLPQGAVDCGGGVEALVRWTHPTRGQVLPQDFIAIAEECGLIIELGDFVLTRACRDFVHWRNTLGEGAPKLLAVNLSKAQLLKPDWHLKVNEILRSTGMDASRLQLEITETLAAQDEVVQESLRKLKSLGLTLALDDFGTGYSSLACLHLLPVDTVKIDRSFVSQADCSPHHRVLIEATVRVAHSLKLSTVAEGIETPEQLAVVRESGCTKVQGYFYSKPLPDDELVSWLRLQCHADAQHRALSGASDLL